MAKQTRTYGIKSREMERRYKLIEEKLNMDVVNVGDFVNENSTELGIHKNLGRDLPHMYDGLTPVERRLIFTMFMHNNLPNNPHVKVATLVGQAIEDVYPHGDLPLNNTHARIGRHWNMMIPYVDGEGNYGDMFTKKPASMRYRKGRLSKYAFDCFFSETNKSNPNFDVRDNYNYSGFEPIALPTKYPNILMQWNTGIGHGISTNIAAFNTTEILEAAMKLIENPEAKIDIYPDMPVPIFIVNKKELKGCFDKNTFTIRTIAPYEVEYLKDKGEDKVMILFKSISITANVSSIISTITKIKQDDEKRQDKKLKEIKDIYVDVAAENTGRTMQTNDDLKQLKFYVELEKGFDPHMVAAKLIDITNFGTSIAASYNVVKDGMAIRSTPRMILLEWINNRVEQKYRSIQQDLAVTFYDLLIARAFITIHEKPKGIEKLIEIMRFHKGANGKKAVRQELADEIVRQFGLNPKQAEYVAGLPLYAINTLSIDELKDKIKKLQEKYDILMDICDDDSIKAIMLDELKEGIKKYGAPRNATFKNLEEAQQRDLYIVYNDKGYYCVNDLNYKMAVDKGFSILKFNTLDELVIFYKDGIVSTVSASYFKESMLNGKAAMFITEANNIKITDIVAVCVNEKKKDKVIISTSNGFMKALDYNDVVKKSSTSIINLEDGDTLSAVAFVKNLDNYIIGLTSEDKMFYTDGANIPAQKKGSSGVRVFKNCKSNVSGICVIPKESEYILMYGESGYIKIVNAEYLSFTKKENYIGMTGKEIKGVVGFKNGKKVALYELSGETDIKIKIDAKKGDVEMSTDEFMFNTKLISSVGAPKKVFKKSKNELYEIVEK